MQISLSEPRNALDRPVARWHPLSFSRTIPATKISRSVRMPIAKDVLIACAGLLETLILGPAMLIMYTFAAWGLSYSIGLSNSFLWYTGPFSNWMIWLGGAVLLSVVVKCCRDGR